MAGPTRREIGKYEILKRLAQGGMAEIFLARQRGIGGFSRRVVLKRILPALAEEKRFVQMFLEEARLASLIHHPNVVQIFDVGEDEGDFFIAMEWVDGLSVGAILDHDVRGGTPVPFPVACEIIVQACAGLHAAHELRGEDDAPLGLVHRDVSPQNLMISKDGVVKLLDFGIAKAVDSAATTRTGNIKGKYAYMSPEQVRGDPLDRRSDLFALGAVFYELLIGKRLFERPAELAMLVAIIEDPIPAANDVDPGVPGELSDLILHALERDRDARFQDAATMRAAVKKVLGLLGHQTSADTLAGHLRTACADKLEVVRAEVRKAEATPSSSSQPEASPAVVAWTEAAPGTAALPHAGDDEEVWADEPTVQALPSLEESAAHPALLDDEPTTEVEDDDELEPTAVEKPPVRMKDLPAPAPDPAPVRAAASRTAPATPPPDDGRPTVPGKRGPPAKESAGYRPPVVVARRGRAEDRVVVGAEGPETPPPRALESAGPALAGPGAERLASGRPGAVPSAGGGREAGPDRPGPEGTAPRTAAPGEAAGPARPLGAGDAEAERREPRGREPGTARVAEAGGQRAEEPDQAVHRRSPAEPGPARTPAGTVETDEGRAGEPAEREPSSELLSGLPADGKWLEVLSPSALSSLQDFQDVLAEAERADRERASPAPTPVAAEALSPAARERDAPAETAGSAAPAREAPRKGRAAVLALGATLVLGLGLGAWAYLGRVPAAPAGPALRYAVPSSYPTETNREGFGPLADYLGKAVGRPVEIVTPRDYRDLRTQIERGEVDLANLPPLIFLQARASGADLEVLASPVYEGSKTYQSYIVAGEHTGIESVEDLAGKAFCYPDRDSTSGYLMPRHFLRSRGLDPDRLFKSSRFSGSHVDVMRDIESGGCDAGAVFSGAWLAARGLGIKSAQIRLVAVAGETARDLVCVGTGMPAGLRGQIKAALLAFDPRRDLGRDVLSPIFPIDGFGEARLEDYLAVEAAARAEGLLEGESP